MDGNKGNYTIFEKNILCELVEKNIDIIESKRNDGRLIEKKISVGKTSMSNELLHWFQICLIVKRFKWS